MAVEQMRGCGYRKVGGLYLVADGLSAPCDRLPYAPLPTCGTCGESIDFSKGFQFVRKPWWDRVVGDHDSCYSCCNPLDPCPVCTPEAHRKLALMWVGQQHYARPTDFTIEAERLGVSKRIPFIPKGLEIGKTWVLLAHIAALVKPCQEHQGIEAGNTNGYREKKRGCPTCKGRGVLQTPGIFAAFRPQRVELIITPSLRSEKWVQEYAERGVGLVEVPDGDPDHQPTARAKRSRSASAPEPEPCDVPSAPYSSDLPGAEEAHADRD